jgi:hypothetical protein
VPAATRFYGICSGRLLASPGCDRAVSFAKVVRHHFTVSLKISLNILRTTKTITNHNKMPTVVVSVRISPLGFESRQQRGSRDEQEKRQRKYNVDIKKTGRRRESEQHQGDDNQSAYDDGQHLLSVLGSALPKNGQ